MNELADRVSLLEIFSEGEIENFLRVGIINRQGHDYKLNYRFVPFEGLLLVAKKDEESSEYAHLNYDSITFVECLRRVYLKKGYQRALEIGCGAGLISLEVAKFATSVDAIDINHSAVKIMEMNAKLNKVDNITSFISDCYKRIDAKYDLIVSDPPFELMPEKEKDVLHRYGGHLGLEIAREIFKGLDSHLSGHGEAIIFTNSYIINYREDTLLKVLKDLFEDKKFKITLSVLSYQINPDFYPLYKKFKISHSISYIIHFQRSNTFEITIIPLPFLGRVKEILRVLYLRLSIILKR